jgi:hypothetical protein
MYLVSSDLPNRDGIHERTVALRFLGIILRFPRLEISTLVFAAFLQMNKHEFSSLIDYVVRISETIGVICFSVRFSSFQCIFFLMVISTVYIYEKYIFIRKKCNKRKNSAFFKGNKEIM